MRSPAAGGIAAAVALVAVTWGCGTGPSSSSASSPNAPHASSRPILSVSALLSGAAGSTVAGAPDDGFARALAPRPFVFPDDDGPHPAFRSEWWYFTGVLRAPDAGRRARRFGYEMTIFRQALAPHPPARASAWATRDVFMGHFAITDIDGAVTTPRFHADERFARDGLGLAGARARPFAVWVDDWRMQGPEAGGRRDGVRSFSVRLSARDGEGAAIDLILSTPGDDHPIAEGALGLSAKGPAPGNASFYYSRPSLATRGRLTLPAAAGGQTFAVEGISWMDREWGTSALDPGVPGWDWLGVHLSDGRDLMMYRLRNEQGQGTAESRVALIAPGAAAPTLSTARFTVTPLELWTSPRTGARYPVALRLEIPEAALDLVVRPLLVEQELRLAVAYWEGAVSLAGTVAGAPITGEGYLELTGYGGGQRQP